MRFPGKVQGIPISPLTAGLNKKLSESTRDNCRRKARNDVMARTIPSWVSR